MEEETRTPGEAPGTGVREGSDRGTGDRETSPETGPETRVREGSDRGAGDREISPETGPETPELPAAAAADLADFCREFPDAAARPAAIPEEVWRRVRLGDRLTDAYAGYAARAGETRRQSAQNAARATGSMRSAAETSQAGTDPFLTGFLD